LGREAKRGGGGWKVVVPKANGGGEGKLPKHLGEKRSKGVHKGEGRGKGKGRKH